MLKRHFEISQCLVTTPHSLMCLDALIFFPPGPQASFFPAKCEHCTDAEFCLKRLYWTGNGAGKQDRKMEI